MSRALEREPVALEESERTSAARAAASVGEYLESRAARGRRSVTLEAESDGRVLRVLVPEPAVRLLVELLRELGKGNAVMVVPFQTELTTQQAADILNVSRPYLVKLLEEGRIPYRTVGPRRRIRYADLMAFKRDDDAYRRSVAVELTQEAVEVGMGYDDDSEQSGSQSPAR
jgi:excisionase family DNA binding protein